MRNDVIFCNRYTVIQIVIEDIQLNAHFVCLFTLLLAITIKKLYSLIAFYSLWYLNFPRI